MLTPEEKRYFKFLWKLGKSYGVRAIEFEIDLDDYPRELDSSFFRQTYNYPYSVEIPEKVAQFLSNFYNTKIYPEIDDKIDEMDIDDPYRQIVFFKINLNQPSVECVVEVSYWETTEPNEQEISVDQEWVDTFKRAVGETSETIFNIDYQGGGDSGYIEDLVLDDGQIISLPDSVTDPMYNMLPGGWEINEGSQGFFSINLEDQTITVEYTENIEDTKMNTILELDF